MTQNQILKDIPAVISLESEDYQLLYYDGKRRYVTSYDILSNPTITAV